MAAIRPVEQLPVALTLPAAAGQLGESIWTVVGLVGKNPDLAAKVFRAGNRRMIRSDDLAAFRAALDAKNGGQR